MLQVIDSLQPYLLLILTAFLSNIILGYCREGAPKFSGRWFFWIHASIPFLIYMRITIGISMLFIPVTILSAIAGQIVGGRIWRKTKTISDIERRELVPNVTLQPFGPVEDSRVLVTLLNMGGPRSIDDVKDFQWRLFSDPLLIRFPLSFLLQKFFAWILIKVRLRSVEKTYMEMGGRSPIYTSTTRQAQALRKELEKRGRNIDVTFSFNYSPPLPEDTLTQAKRHGKDVLLPVSLYPHYSKATTGSNLHYLRQAAKRVFPECNVLTPPSYYLHDGYIQSFVDRIHETLRPEESLDDFYLLFSAHGLPLYFLKEGDPYPFQIAHTMGAILSKLQRNDSWTLAYQSAVGPLQWLKPATVDMIRALARRGIKKVIVIPVAFVGDHIETICEIDREYRDLAEHLGIEDYRMTKAIETHAGFITALADAVENALLISNTIDRSSCSQLNHSVQEALKQ